jgi:hypothetical protein
MKNKFTYDQLMQWDKNDLAEKLLEAQSDIDQLLKCMKKLMKKNNDE